MVQTETLVRCSTDRYIALGCVKVNVFVLEQRERDSLIYTFKDGPYIRERERDSVCFRLLFVLGYIVQR